MDGSWWRVLTKRGSLEKGMANHAIILALRTHEPYERQKDMTLNVPCPRLGRVQYATERDQRNSSRRNKEAEPKQKQCPVVDVPGGESKVRYCKEQYYIGTWNVRSVNQGNLEVIKQEMTRVNIDISGMSELKKVGMGEFNSDNRYIYYCGQESL